MNPQNSPAAYDIVGKYNQDEINGFDEEFLTSFVELVDLENAENILDAMGGDGNLTRRIINYCVNHKIDIPLITLLEYSSVQTELARTSIDSNQVKIINGDVLSMKDLKFGEKLPENSFDRVVIKSGTHEIHPDKQQQLYLSIFQALKPGGLFINLGFLFDDIQERDEFAEITTVKENLLGAMDAAANRYFLMRQEFYQFLHFAGFKEIKGHTRCEYVIRSEIVEKEYFSQPRFSNAMSELRAAQKKAMTLQSHGRILLETNRSTMRLPGEITLAIKPL